MRTVDETLLGDIVRRLVAEFEPEEIFLFGSHVTGAANEDSDVDLLVIVSDSNEPPTARATRALRALGRIMAPLDVIVRTRAEVERHRPLQASLTRQVLDEGRLLYGRGKAKVGA